MLRNRFNEEELRNCWTFWFRCLWCSEAGADCFHHVISPSSPRFVEGDFNSSVLNACPIHNEKCHLYNSELHKEKNEKFLLQKILTILLSNGYRLKEKDVEFLKAYHDLYDIKNRQGS